MALLVERVAYRRLRRRNAPPLVALISAIGASFVLGEIMGLRDRIAGWFGLRDSLDDYVRGAATTPASEPDRVRADVHGRRLRVTNIDLIVIAARW